jgi:hypothetical protein
VGLRRRRGLLVSRRRRAHQQTASQTAASPRRSRSLAAIPLDPSRRRRAKRRDERPEVPGHWQDSGSEGVKRSLRPGATGSLSGVEGRQTRILEEQSILEESDHVQMYVSSVGF